MFNGLLTGSQNSLLQKANTMDRKILVTGDYWNPEFRSFLTGFDAVTLVPIKKVSATEQSFDLVVIAQAEPGQFSLETIEQLQMQFGNTPLVAVLGSWCEGEQRTGQPWPGVLRIIGINGRGDLNRSFSSWKPKASLTGTRLGHHP